jgi:hypothetical protein
MPDEVTYAPLETLGVVLNQGFHVVSIVELLKSYGIQVYWASVYISSYSCKYLGNLIH